jgi:glycosyltransferase involved in cell wall biosynthesis
MTSLSQPLISIVLPTYNGRRYIAQSIESCLSQSYNHFELIVVDGGSTDGTLDVVQAIADPRIKIVHQPANTGLLPGALNYGFAKARGAYYTWTQDDDYYAPEALQTLANGLANHPDAGMVYTGMYFIDPAGAICRDEPTRPPEALYISNPVGCCFMYRREIAELVGPYDVNFYMSEDSHYWMRIYKHSKIVQLPGKYFYHRLHPDSLTVKNYGAYKALRVGARARREVLGLSWLEYQRRISAAYIEEAFAAYNRADYDHVLHCLSRAIWRSAGWLTNRGVWSIYKTALLQKITRQC